MARSAKPRKRKPAPQRSKLPRYVVKLHPDDFFDEEDAEFCTLIILTMPLSAALTWVFRSLPSSPTGRIPEQGCRDNGSQGIGPQPCC
ncbi:hypothetical protein ABCZ07_004986 [Escherichia coli]|nr:hypothetical protein [Escherichia coli]EJD2849672.1 hypothetical protein [Escherichia coli]EKK0705324.1 hypothetical protein [Escherichia coli]MEB7221852.1 hypothetical protein [Escherichia coli]